MDSELSKFIHNKRENNGFYTHVSQISPLGKFNFQRKDSEDFWKLYCDSLANKRGNFISGLAENNKNFKYLPIVNDTDIKLEYDEKKFKNIKRLYKDSHILETVKIYQKYIKNIVKNYRPEHGICYVLEKEHPTILKDKNKISHGFHLHFPFIFMSKIDQEIHLLPRIKTEINDKKIFEDIGIKSDECIDKTTDKCWLMYGSRKDVSKEFYKVSKIYNDQLEIITLEQSLKNYTLYDSFGEPIDMSGNYSYYLPRILSIDPENKDIVLVAEDLSIIVKNQFKKMADIKKTYDDIPIPESLKRARQLLKLISPTRADNYGDWMDIGWILNSVGCSCEEALEMWIDFSSKTTKQNYFSEKYCVYLWGRMENRGKSLGSLKYLAKEDNPEEYNKIQKDATDRLAQEIINGGHYDLALWLKNKFGDEYKCYDDTKGHWFRYINHRWRYDQNGLHLKMKIPIILVDEFKKRRKKIMDELAGEDNMDLSSNKTLKSINKIIANLKSVPFIKSVMTACQMLFYDEEFVEKLDTDPYLLHFSNGVLDLKTRKLRAGKPDDFVSLTTGYDFKEMNGDDPEVIMLHEHLNKIFPDPELKQYFLEYCAMLLVGGNKAKTFLVLSGQGDNGKSINMELLKLVLGKYMRILPTTVLTGKKAQSSQATPELDGIAGVRYCICQEPEGKETINIGTLKELTGNDEIYIRGLFKEGRNVLPLFKLALICNSLPRLPFDDPATWNRIRVLLHESKFPKDSKLVPESLDEQFAKKTFPRDDFFSEKLPKMKQPMMWLMFDTLGKIKMNGRIKEPIKVTEATLLYRENNDVFYQFIKERIIKESDETHGITILEAFTAFRDWFKNSFPNVNIPDKNDMKKDLLLKWGELGSNRKWNGYRIREEKDDIKDGNVIILNEDDLAVVEHKDNEHKDDNKRSDDKEMKRSEVKVEYKDYAAKYDEPVNIVDNDNDMYLELDDNENISKFLNKRVGKKKVNKYIFEEEESDIEIEMDNEVDDKSEHDVESEHEVDDEQSDSDEDDKPLKSPLNKSPLEELIKRKIDSDDSEDEASESDDIELDDDELSIEISSDSE